MLSFSCEPSGGSTRPLATEQPFELGGCGAHEHVARTHGALPRRPRATRTVT